MITVFIHTVPDGHCPIDTKPCDCLKHYNDPGEAFAFGCRRMHLAHTSPAIAKAEKT